MRTIPAGIAVILTDVQKFATLLNSPALAEVEPARVFHPMRGGGAWSLRQALL